MMEKPTRWLVASIALIALSLLLVYKKEINLGADLRGGTRLLYRIDLEKAKTDGLVEADADPADIRKRTIDVMLKRVDSMGLREINVVAQGDDEIVVELPGLTDTEISNIKDTITSLGRLEFRLIADATDQFDVEREKGKLDAFLDLPDSKTKIETWQKEEIAKDPNTSRNLIFWTDLLRSFNGIKGDAGPVKGLRWYVDSGSELFARGKDKQGNPLPWTEQNRKVRPSIQPVRIEDQLDPRDGSRFTFRGDDLTQVFIGRDQRGGNGIHFSIVAGRRNDFGEFTERSIGRRLAIILNDQIDSAPNINSELREGGVIESQSVGGYSPTEARQLLTVLETGSLKVKPKLDSEARLGASLGEDSIRLGVYSSVAALIATIGFMVIYYRVAGIIAAVSLAVNGTILLGVLSLYNATLTLPGIGGFILTLAMAVDSNILIYERIREERDRGRGVEQAVRLGFERAFVTIIDSNLTTLATSFVLYWIGTGPIKGLGLTLSVGILTTLFAALVFTKAVFGFLLERKLLPEVKMMRMFKATPNLNFIKIWKITVAVSVLTSIAGLAAFFVSPESVFGIDFVGGATARVRLREPMELSAFRDAVNTTPGFEKNVDANQSLSAGSIIPGKPGFREYVVKGKLTREKRDAIKADTQGTVQEQVSTFRSGLRTSLGDRILPDPVSNIQIKPGAAPADPSNASFVLNFEDPVEQSVVQERLAKLMFLTAPAVTPAGDTKLAYNIAAQVAPGTSEEMLRQRVPDGFSQKDGAVTVALSDPFPEIATIQPRAAKSLKNKAILALLASFALIILYVRFRFHEYRYGIGGVVGIIHDLVVTIGIVAIANMTGLVDVEIDMTLVAVFLTIAGYSINDTIVIYDRIRENLARPESERASLERTVDDSCNQTLSRTLLTSTAAFLSSALMFFVNRGQHNPLEGFGFTMMVGIASGTYSSIWVASLFVVGVERWNERRARNSSRSGGGAPRTLPAKAVATP